MTDMKLYKGFDVGLACRDFQFEIGKTYTIDGKIQLCRRGFHACESPFDVWNFYGPAKSRFALILAEKVSDETHNEDTKRVAAKITINAEIDLPDFITAGVKWVVDYIKSATTGYYAHAATTGDDAHAATTGDHAIACALGYSGKAKASASKGGWIVLVQRNDEGEILDIKRAKAGHDIEPDTWYRLNEAGEFEKDNAA